MSKEADSAIQAVRRLVDAKYIAQLLSCDERTVYRRADEGAMPWGVKIGALRRWDLEEINRWIEDGCKPVRTITTRGSR